MIYTREPWEKSLFPGPPSPDSHGKIPDLWGLAEEREFQCFHGIVEVGKAPQDQTQPFPRTGNSGIAPVLSVDISGGNFLALSIPKWEKKTHGKSQNLRMELWECPRWDSGAGLSFEPKLLPENLGCSHFGPKSLSLS